MDKKWRVVQGYTLDGKLSFYYVVRGEGEDPTTLDYLSYGSYDLFTEACEARDEANAPFSIVGVKGYGAVAKQSGGISKVVNV